MRAVIVVTTIASLSAMATPACTDKAPPEVVVSKVEAGSDGLPPDFPPSVPAYPGAKDVVAPKTLGPQGGPVWNVSFSTTDNPDAVLSYYAANLHGFRGAGENLPSGERVSLWESQQYSVSLRAIPGGTPDAQVAGTAVTVTVSRR
jgi:hypothetical protein